ncbi:MAG: hypothetical protein FWF35_03640 [Elusimicrobia bacterium]|nr:hypothetical protein [Elusimicrobiota bacterium]
MKKILMMFGAMTLTAGLFAQLLPDTAKVQQQWADYTKNSVFEFPKTDDKPIQLKTNKEALKKFLDEERERHPGEMAAKMIMINRPAKLEKISFSMFKDKVNNTDTAAFAGLLEKYQQDKLDTNDKVAVAVFNNIKSFYEKSLSAKDQKAAFIQFVSYDYENETNKTYEEGYTGFFFRFTMAKLFKPIPPLPDFNIKQPKLMNKKVSMPLDTIPVKQAENSSDSVQMKLLEDQRLEVDLRNRR